jgi:protein SCO1
MPKGVANFICSVTRSAMPRGVQGVVAAAVIGVSCFATVAAFGQGYGQHALPTGTPVAMPAPGIVDKQNAIIKLQELEFKTSEGKTVKLDEVYNQGRPVILQLVYFSCPNLCGFSQDDLARTVASEPRGLKLGKDFDIVVVSIDDEDTTEDAAKKRASYLRKMNMPESQAGFTYLTGSAANIRMLAETVGFGYRRNYGPDLTETAGKYAHSGGIFITTSYGLLSQTMLGLNYSPDTLHNALRLAANGKIGGTMLGIGLSCGAVHFDPATGTYKHNPYFYAGVAVGGASLIFMGMFLGSLWLGEAKKAKKNRETPNTPAGTPATQ